MNDAQQLADFIKKTFAVDKLEIESPDNPSGSWWIHAWSKEKFVEIEWRPNLGFGISLILNGDFESAMFGGPDNVFPDLDAAQNYVTQLLISDLG